MISEMIDERQKAGDVISYREMCSAIGVSVQRGMSFPKSKIAPRES
jgi:hypothetical protein